MIERDRERIERDYELTKYLKQLPEQESAKFLVKRVRELGVEEEYTNEEIKHLCSAASECVIDAVREYVAPFLLAYVLPSEIRERITSAQLDSLKWYTLINLTGYEGSDEVLFGRLDRFVEKFTVKVTNRWFQHFQDSITDADIRDALMYINEGMFRIEVKEDEYNALEEGVPDELLRTKNFISRCLKYLERKDHYTSAACIELNRFAPEDTAKGSITISSSGTSSICGTSGINEQPPICLSDYLIGEGADIYQRLQEEYWGTKPTRQVYMIMALKGFEVIKKNCESELSDFHKALLNSFGGSWSREAYRKHFERMSKGTSSKEEAKISAEGRIIRNFMKS
ncbi:hypothetical protein CLV24_11990 [Pontibacter ummariensis]|uniref:Uncharacterized protein n=1 Tax=Pontibacter ummariensis TaxID=1610492 RepID=A0A239IZD0_9BACT|nr:hypothetical protein [Pontibacter ummariensis]PRY09039.1 hypothetical protein CLV24_11990 [Pontibacter ummariensis]SNS98919.1 hypothetical protein SAMN06296052_11990 [Pontibacter ummariensis]